VAKSIASSIRFTPEVRAALQKAAKAEDRSFSNLNEHIVAEWLRARGYLPKEPKAPKGPGKGPRT
jgi:hypothetical protein